VQNETTISLKVILKQRPYSFAFRTRAIDKARSALDSLLNDGRMVYQSFVTLLMHKEMDIEIVIDHAASGMYMSKVQKT